jgi:F-type H+-transporting ATPase subunit b
VEGDFQMIDINGSLFIQIANFLLMMIVLNYLLYRPIRTILKERRETFQGYEADISSLVGQVDERLTEIERRLADARRDGFLRKDAIKGEGLNEEKQIIARATDEADTEIERIKRQVAGEINVARDALKADVSFFSRELAQKLLGRSLS